MTHPFAITVTRAIAPQSPSPVLSCLLYIPISIAPILTAGLARRHLATMVSKTSKPDEPTRRMSHSDFAERLAARRKELGNPELPRNSGKRRTSSKRALLKAIEDAGGDW